MGRRGSRSDKNPPTTACGESVFETAKAVCSINVAGDAGYTHFHFTGRMQITSAFGGMGAAATPITSIGFSGTAVHVHVNVATLQSRTTVKKRSH